MSEKMKWILFALAIILGIKILKDIGILDTKEDVQADALSTLNAFNPNLWRDYKDNNKNVITKAQAVEYSKTIFDAKGYTYDTDDTAIGVLRKLKSKAQVSYVSYMFNFLYKRDLASYLEFMSEKNMALANTLVSKLPKK